MGAWEGHAELQQALKGLASAKGTSATRVKAVANAAFKYVKDYKRVVHDVEMFLWKSDVEHRLAGLYVVDAIIRQVKYGSKDQFTKRFALHLTNTITAVKSIPDDSQQHVRHVIQEWQARGFYTTSQIEDAGGSRYSINSTSGKPYDPHFQREETSPTASSGKLASLLSIIKKQKERHHDNPAANPSSSSILGDAPMSMQRSSGPLLSSPPRSDRTLSPQSQQSRAPDSSYNQPHYASRDAYGNDERSRGGGLLPEPPASAAIGRRFRPTGGDGSEWHEAREVKKSRGSRWGPPKAPSGGEDLRPPPINTVATTPKHEDLPPRYGANDGASLLQSPTRRGDGQQQQYGPPGGVAARPSPGQYPPSVWQQGGSVPPQAEIPRVVSPGGRVGYGVDREAGVMNEARRKTVLCANFPKGTCRFGVNCSFAHGEHELVRSSPAFRGGGAGAVAAAAAQQNRAIGTGMTPLQPAYNEVQGGRGDAGAPSMLTMGHPANGAGGAPPLQTPTHHQQFSSAQASSGHGAPAPAATAAKDTFAPGRAPPAPPAPAPGTFVQGHGYRGGGPPPPGPPMMMMMAGAPPLMRGPPPGPSGPPLPLPPPGAPLSSTPVFPPPQAPLGGKPVPETRRPDPTDDDDEEADSAAPEFTLEYDDED